MKKYNLSEIMKRAWEFVKKNGISISTGLKMAWAEAKDTVENLIDVLVKKLEVMAHEDYHIHAGIDRQVVVNKWEKEGHKRAYLDIRCYTLNNKFKRSYKCGYVDLVTGTYVCGKYDDVNAETSEYVGR